MKSKIVYPYGTKREIAYRLLGPPSDRDLHMRTWLDQVWAHFRVHKFSMERATEFLAKPAVFKTVHMVMQKLLIGEWVYVASGNVKTLQALALICPMATMLTTRQASYTVTTKGLMGLFLAPVRHDPDNLVQAEATVLLRSIEKGGLMVWNEIGVRHAGAPKLESHFSSILSSYADRKKPILALHLLQQGETPTVEWLLEKIRTNVGPHIGCLFDSYTQFIIFTRGGTDDTARTEGPGKTAVFTDPSEE